MPGDDIDALALMDAGTSAVFDAGDLVWFSLTPGSPSAAALGTASIIETAAGGAPFVLYPPATLSLLAGDDLNALTGGDPPVCDIKANGKDGPLGIPQGDPLSVTVALDAGGSAGIPADWYVCADSPFGPYYYTYPSGSWVPGACSPAVSNLALFDLPTYPVLNMTLPAGAYSFCFTVDTGIAYSDCVDVNIQ